MNFRSAKNLSKIRKITLWGAKRRSVSLFLVGPAECAGLPGEVRRGQAPPNLQGFAGDAKEFWNFGEFGSLANLAEMSLANLERRFGEFGNLENLEI